LQPNGKVVNIEVLLSCKDYNSKSIAFFQCYESSPFKASTKEWGSSTSIKKKHMKDLSLLQQLLDFIALVEEFFHPPS